MFRLFFFLLVLFPGISFAGPESFKLDAERSTVSFTYDLNGAHQTGRMQVTSTDLLIDLDNLPASQVQVTLDARTAQAGLIIATEAMKGRSVLDTARHPEIHFRSTRIRGNLRQAEVAGELTIRGVTRPITLTARLFRQRGTALHDRNNLLIELTGAISRAAFGASGYATFVGDRIDLRIIAMINR